MFLPFGNHTENPAIVWKAEPTLRGSYSILSGCILTLVLCIWTAVHLNIPEPEDANRSFLRKRQLWRKIGSLILGLVAPELVALTAWFQYKAAQEMGRAMRTVLVEPQRPTFWTRTLRLIGCIRNQPDDGAKLNDEEARKRNNRHNEWTSTHSQYAIMGGFQFDTSDRSAALLPENDPRTRLCIELTGLILLAVCDSELIPDISVQQIRDKSKADSLTKTLVCLEAVWFCVQCFSLLVYGLPLSLLELNTFAHALCALITYGLWWNKPFDVGEPTLIQGERSHKFIALFSIIGHVGRGVPMKSLLREYCKTRASMQHPGNTYQPSSRRNMEDRYSRQLTPDEITQQHDPHTELDPQHTTDRDQPWSPSRPVHTQEVSDVQGKLHEASAHQIQHIRLAYEALFQSGLIDPSQTLGHDFLPIPEFTYIKKQLTSNRNRNWPAMLTWYRYKRNKTTDRVLWVALLLAGLLYGGLHLFAWNAPFPSQTEKLLWHISGVIVASFALAAYLARVLYYIYFRFTSRPGIHEPSRQVRDLYDGSCGNFRTDYGFQVALWVVFVEMITLLYISARVYLVVECFISFAHLPEAVFQQPVWSNYFPHFG